MKKLLPLISAIGLTLVIVPAILYLAVLIEKPLMQGLMATGTVLWFFSIPDWSRKP